MVAANPPQDRTWTITLTDRQLWMIRSSLEDHLATFSHTEPEIIHELKILLVYLPIPRGLSPS